MSFDFNYGDSTINSSGGFIPTKKNAPTNPREVVDTYADIADIPNPYVGLTVTVKVDETNNNKMTDYKVISLKSNNLGIADMLIDQVQRMDEYLGALKEIPAEYVTETEMNEAIANVSSGGGLTSDQLVTLNKVPTIEQDVVNLKTTLGDKNGLPSGDTNVVSGINRINNSIGVEELSTTAKTLKGAINEVFQDVDNGKTLIASAITDKGIATSDNDTFQVMADNISKINSVITDININSYNILKDNWKFKLLSNNGTDRSYTNEISQSYDDSTFENISVPHDWAIYKEFNSSSPGSYEGGYLDGGDGVYRIKLDTTSLNGQKVFLYFDGIFMESEVYINGNLIGLNKWYNPFYFDITNSLNFDENDTLAVLVRVKQPCSRWYSGAGIFRNVYLVTGNYIDVAINSIHVTTPNLETELTKGYATTNVKMSINNKNEESKNINIKNEIYFNNELVAYNNEAKLLSNGSNEYTCNILVPSPKLWHEYQGNLYTLKTIIQIDGAEVYINYTKYGYRYFKFDKDTGFWLNGINMKLRGVCLHHDLGCLGAEVNKSAIERQIRILKNMGCNAIRLTHNPASTELLEICAKEGMLLIEELFDCWTSGKKANDFARFFNEYSERVIKFTVNRGKNNPAIIMYSIGNEIIRVSEGLTEQTATALVSNMINTIKSIDIERMVTMGEDSPDKPVARAVMQLMDVVGVNYGSNSEYASLREAYPEFKVYGSETTSALSSRGIYARDNTKLQCSSKDNDFVGWGDSASEALKRHMDSDYLAGMFVWTGFDYIGEPTPFNKYPARSSYFGIIDLAGFPKDIYYMYQSRWTKKPMIHVFPHWNWENGNTVNVWLYSNCDKVELFVNGVSKGIKTKDSIGSKYNYEYNVSYEAGTLLAKGMDSAGNVLVQEEIKTSSTPYKIFLTSDKSLIKQGGDDLIFVECNVLDENDIVCRTASNLINFSVNGGTIVGTDNGDATDVSSSLRSPNRKLFNGKALCVVKPDNTDTDVIITATSDGLQETSINVKKSQITAYANSIVKIPGDIDAPLPPIINYATGISFKNNTIQLKQTKQYQLEITLMGGDVFDSITYSANNENVSVTNSGLVTGNTLGESIITVTMIANGITYEDTCTITITENTTAEPVEGVLYNLDEPTTFDGSNFIDTGVCARDTDKDLTIFISYNGEIVAPRHEQYSVMHCMLESGGYPGISIDTTLDDQYRIGTRNGNYYLLDDEGNPMKCTNCSNEQKVCIRITSGSNAINIKYKIEEKNASVKTINGTMNTATFNNTILLGAYRDAADNKGRYWKGTINSFTVYDKVLTDEEVNALFGVEPPLPPTPPTPPTTDDYTALDISGIQKGQPFTLYDGALDLNNQTVFADMILNDTHNFENVLSVGMNISEWNGIGMKLHCYYPKSVTAPNKEIEIALINPGEIKAYATIVNNILKIALNANGVYVNGTKVDAISQSSNFNSFVAQKTAQIGSLQGDQRSEATYNEVGIYNRLLSSEELITLTSIA